MGIAAFFFLPSARGQQKVGGGICEKPKKSRPKENARGIGLRQAHGATQGYRKQGKGMTTRKMQ
jgi:hypothetical protein